MSEAISGETFEFKQMYPAMIETAVSENEKSAQRSFTFANEVEKVHAELYQKVLDDLENLPEVNYYICPICGNTVENEPPETCPVCKAKGSSFEKMK